MGAIKINGSTSGSTTITAPATGSDETIELSTALDAKAPLASPTFTGTVALPATTTLDGATLALGKILQIVRATDGTNRTTSSTSFADASLSVTITPTSATSAVLLIASVQAQAEDAGSNPAGRFVITDSSNNSISGAEGVRVGMLNTSTGGTQYHLAQTTIFAYATPATTSAVTYKLRFRSEFTGQTLTSANSANTAQMYAIEVSS